MIKSPPHVILMLGAHAWGAEPAIEKVLRAEKPKALAVEFPELHEKLEGVKAYGGKITVGPFTSHSAIYQIAQRHRIDFHAAEHHDAKSHGLIERSFDTFGEQLEKTSTNSNEGNVEGAINSYRKFLENLRETVEMRDKNMADTVHKLTSVHDSIAVFAGSGHINLAKKLRDRGLRVTVYHAPTADYTYELGLSAKNTRGQMLKGIFNHMVTSYLVDRYDEVLAIGLSARAKGTDARKLRSIPAEAIEEFIRGLKGKTPVGRRTHFIEFCAQHGVKFPTPEEAHKLVMETPHPPFRKIKVLEPHRV